DESELANAPETFKSTDGKVQLKGLKYTVQVAPEDCTGCGLCVQNCPGKDKNDPNRKAINMAPQEPIREQERENWEFFLGIEDKGAKVLPVDTVKGSQF